MRVDKVEIDNALCFRHLTMPLNHSFQLIAGPNNAGKSSFVRLVEMFFSDPSGGGRCLQSSQPTPTTPNQERER